jgi:putative ABC transport system permease protein
MIYFVATIASILLIAIFALLPLFLVLFAGELTLNNFPFGRVSRYLLLVVKSLRRNLLRTSLTYLAAFVLVIVVTMVWSVLFYLDQIMMEKTKDLKVIVSEKWEANSQMPFSYAATLADGAARSEADLRPDNSMTWQFYVGTLDATKKAPEDAVFFIALEPVKVLTMMDDLLNEFDPVEAKNMKEPRLAQQDEFKEAVEGMIKNKRGVIMGKDRLEKINKRKGESFKLTSMNYSGIDLEFDIVGVFPKGRYNDSAVMNRAYLNDAIENYKGKEGTKHPLADKSLNLVWLQVKDPQAFGRISEQIETSSSFRNPPVKCETLASGVASWLGGYQDLIWGMRWLLAPAVLLTMTLVLSNSISISVRERRMEMAVLKVLGFRPFQILMLVLGEALLIGTVSGGLSALTTYLAIDEGLARTQGAVGVLYIPPEALLWGPTMGGIAGFIGSIFPAWTACRIKVTDVFARVA